MILIIFIFIQHAAQTTSCSKNRCNILISIAHGVSVTTSFNFINDFDFYDVVDFPSVEKPIDKLPKRVTLWKNIHPGYISLLKEKIIRTMAIPTYYGCFVNDDGTTIYITSAIKVEEKNHVRQRLLGIAPRQRVKLYTNVLSYYYLLKMNSLYDIDMQPDRIKFSEDAQQLIVIPSSNYVENIDFDKLMIECNEIGSKKQLYNKPTFYDKKTCNNCSIKETLYSFAKVIAYFEIDDFESTLNNINSIMGRQICINGLKKIVTANNIAEFPPLYFICQQFKFRHFPDTMIISTIHDIITDGLPNFGHPMEPAIDFIKNKLRGIVFLRKTKGLTFNGLISKISNLYDDPSDDFISYMNMVYESKIENNNSSDKSVSQNQSKMPEETTILKEITDTEPTLFEDSVKVESKIIDDFSKSTQYVI